MTNIINKETAKEIRETLNAHFYGRHVTVKMGKDAYIVTVRHEGIDRRDIQVFLQYYDCPIQIVFAEGIEEPAEPLKPFKKGGYGIRITKKNKPAKEEPKAEETKTEEIKEEAPAEKAEEPKKEEVQKDPNAPKTQKEKIAERIEKNETKLEKAKALLAKKEAKAAKKSEMDEFEYSYLLEEIEGKKYQIEELEALIERQRKQLETAKDEISEKTKKELIMKQLPELPKVLKDLRDDLETRIFDMLIRENEDKKSYKRDEEVLKRDAAYEANLLVKDVWAKIFEKTGNLIECDVYNGGWQINGIFKGEKGTAKVQTVFAGGYNIQCLHMRTLVHEI